jgi:hypothetical protein
MSTITARWTVRWRSTSRSVAPSPPPEDHRRMHERLVVHELVKLGRLDLVVQVQGAAVADRVHDLELLELGLLAEDDSRHVADDVFAAAIGKAVPEGHASLLGVRPRGAAARVWGQARQRL